MTTPRTARPAAARRGSALLLVLVLLAVLAAVGVAAVGLGAQDRINSSAKGKRDAMAACANAARLVIWAELAKYGSARLGSALTESQVTLGDGTMLSAPAHFSPDTTPQVISLRNYSAPLGGANAAPNPGLGTNTIVGDGGGIGSGGKAYAFSARCRDFAGRETEVEFTAAFVF
jgi:hypothetical protein